MIEKTSPIEEVVACIPTFRRADRLIRLLEGISRQDYQGPLAVVIADNDAQNPTMSTLEVPANLAKKLSWFTVEERGVSIVRNRLIEFALEHFPTARWLAFIDDDEVPSPTWLHHLVTTAVACSSDLVGGPVFGILPEQSSTLAQNSMYAVRRTQTSGHVDMLIGTNNLLISTNFLRNLKRSPFLAEFGRTGGEDYEFLRYAKSNGARFSWSEEAAVWEDVEPHRLAAQSLLKRYLGVGAYHARIDYRYLNFMERVANLRRRLRWLGAATIRAMAGVESRKNFAQALLAGAASLGYVIGLCGIKIKLY